MTARIAEDGSLVPMLHAKDGRLPKPEKSATWIPSINWPLFDLYGPVNRKGGSNGQRPDQIPMWQRWAQFRFAVIGKLLSSPPPKGQLQKAIERLCRQTYQHPIDANRRISIGASTIERWYYKAKTAADPIAALGRKIRSDAGIRWSMSEPLLAALKSQYEDHRRWNVQLHYDNLAVLVKEQPRLGPMVSYKTVLRCMRDNGWLQIHQPALPTRGQKRAAERLQRREVRGFAWPVAYAKFMIMQRE